MRSCCAIVLFCLASCLFTWAFAAESTTGVGVVVGHLRGTAESLEGGDLAQGRPLQEGQKLVTPVVVRVAQGSRLGLVFPDQSVFRLAGPAMALVRDAIVLPDERIMELELSKGQSWLGVRPFSGSMDTVRLMLPASVLTTAAGQCQVRVGRDRRVMVAVFGGEVHVQSSAGAEALAAGEDRNMESAGLLFENDEDRGDEPKPLDMGSSERTLVAGEMALLGLSGKVGEKRTMTPVEQHSSAWAGWNMARDRKQSTGQGQEAE